MRKAKIETGAEVILTVDPAVLGNCQRFSCSYEGITDDVSIGDSVLINDGAIRLEVIALEGRDVRCRVKVGGTIYDHKGINLPGTPVSIPALTPKDIEDLKFGLEHEVDYVALSFVRSADDLRLIKRYAPTTPIIAKLEKPQAVDRVDEIAQLAEGGMIARGDLGVEMPLERVPLIQKTAIERTNHYGKIAIVATQMLESMIVSPQPTRAEVSDVANAVLDGADSVMLSAETATGAYPVEAVKTMAAIVEEVERSARYQALPDPSLDRGESTFATAVARACAAAAQQLGIGTICVYTRTGETARQLLPRELRLVAILVRCSRNNSNRATGSRDRRRRSCARASRLARSRERAPAIRPRVPSRGIERSSCSRTSFAILSASASRPGGWSVAGGTGGTAPARDIRANRRSRPSSSARAPARRCPRDGRDRS